MIDRVDWLVPSRIILFEVSGQVMLQDVRDLTRDIRAMIEADDQTNFVDVFLDVNRVTGYHPETMNIGKLFGAAKPQKRVRWNIIINPHPNPILDFVVRTVCQLFKTQLRIVPTLDEAVTFIQTKTAPEKS